MFLINPKLVVDGKGNKNISTKKNQLFVFL